MVGWCSATQISLKRMRACPFCQCSVYRTKSFVDNLQNSFRLKNEGPHFQQVSCMVVNYALGLKIRHCSAKHKSLVKLITHQPLKWQFWHRFCATFPYFYLQMWEFKSLETILKLLATLSWKLKAKNSSVVTKKGSYLSAIQSSKLWLVSKKSGKKWYVSNVFKLL